VVTSRFLGLKHDQQQNLTTLYAFDESSDQVQCGLVSPVHILEVDQQRGVAGKKGEEIDNRIKEIFAAGDFEPLRRGMQEERFHNAVLARGRPIMVVQECTNFFIGGNVVREQQEPDRLGNRTVGQGHAGVRLPGCNMHR